MNTAKSPRRQSKKVKVARKLIPPQGFHRVAMLWGKGLLKRGGMQGVINHEPAAELAMTQAKQATV